MVIFLKVIFEVGVKEWIEGRTQSRMPNGILASYPWAGVLWGWEEEWSILEHEKGEV